MSTYPTMQGKTVLVSGATGGIGKITALRLAELGATVVGIGRSLEKCAQVAGEIRAASGNSAVEFITADLSTIEGNRRAAAEFKQSHSRLDVLVNNAGAFHSRRILTADGLEMTFALNHIGYFVLTAELRDLLIHSAPSRVVVVSSDAHVGGRMNFADLQYEKGYNGWLAYGQSKLANLLFSFELARRMQEHRVDVNALHPGFVATGFARNNGPLYKAAMAVISKFTAISPEEGARTTIHLAASPEVENITGKYFYKCQVTQSSKASLDTEAARRLWEISEQIANRR